MALAAHVHALLVTAMAFQTVKTHKVVVVRIGIELFGTLGNLIETAVAFQARILFDNGTSLRCFGIVAGDAIGAALRVAISQIAARRCRSSHAHAA